MRKNSQKFSIRNFLDQFRQRAIFAFIFSILILAVGAILTVSVYQKSSVRAISYANGTIITGSSNGTEEIINADVEITEYAKVEFNRHITINGNLTLKKGSTLTHAPQGFFGAEGGEGMYLTVGGVLILEQDAQINMDGKGYEGGKAEFREDLVSWYGGYYYYKLNKFYSSNGSENGYSWWQENGSGNGGKWIIGGTGGGNGFRTQNRGGSAGGGGGAYGYGSGAKSNYGAIGTGTCPGGGAGWNGQGGTGAQCAGSTDLTNGTTGSFVYDNALKFGGGGGAGICGFENVEGGYSENGSKKLPTSFEGGRGGGIIQIKSDKIVLNSRSFIKASGNSGSTRICNRGVLDNKSAISGAGGAGTIYIATNNLEMAIDSYLSASGGDGNAICWNNNPKICSGFSTSGAGGGGLIYIKLNSNNSTVKIGSDYLSSFNDTKISHRILIDGGRIRDAVSNSLLSKDITGVPPEADGGDGKYIFEGNPTVPTAPACDLSLVSVNTPSLLKNPDKSSYNQGEYINYTVTYESKNTDLNCAGQFQLFFNTSQYINKNSAKVGSDDFILQSRLPQPPAIYKLDRTSIGTYTANIEVQVDTHACVASAPPLQQVLFWQQYDNGAKISLTNQHTINISCPNLNIENEVGAQGDIQNNKITLKGPSIVTRGNASSYTGKTEGAIIDLKNYAYNSTSLDFSAIEKNFEKLKVQRAKNMSGTGVFNLNPSKKPEGGVWQIANGNATLDKTFTEDSHGIIFHEGNLIIQDIAWNTDNPGTLGIVVKDGDVTIKDKSIKNVAIYAYGAGKGKITFDFAGEGVDVSGSFIGNSIEIKESSGTIKYAPALNTAPPPGFSSLVDEIQTLK